MPELPEVESVRRTLAQRLPGRRISDIIGESIELRRELDVPKMKRSIKGDRFKMPDRQAKFLILPLKSRKRILIHLGMSGKLVFTKPDAEEEKHTHLRFLLDNDEELRYIDPRRFGFVDVLTPKQVDPSLERLGMDPLDPNFPQAFANKARKMRSPVKSILMNQRVVGGIGNIYATEALWLAGIHPKRKGSRTSGARLSDLAVHVTDILKAAIEGGGTTLKDFEDPDGNSGEYLQQLNVYGREGENCPRCEEPLQTLSISRRTTVFCPSCQR